MKLWFMILIKCQIRSKYEWLRNSTPEKVFREFSPLIVLVCPPKCQDIYSLWTKCNLRARACPPVSGATPPTTPAPCSGGGAPPRTTWAWGPGAGTSRWPVELSTTFHNIWRRITRLLLQHFENVMENDVIENDEEGNDNICYEAIDENNEDYLDMNCGNK